MLLSRQPSHVAATISSCVLRWPHWRAVASASGGHAASGPRHNFGHSHRQSHPHGHRVRRGALHLGDGPRKRRLSFEVHEAAGACRASGFIWTHGLTSSMGDEAAGGWPFGGVAGLAGMLPVTRYDARGHGSSDTAEGRECTWPQMGRDIVELRRAWARRRTFIGGTSMGAAASLYAALEAPDLFAGLVLATPPTCYGGRQKFVPMYRESVNVARQGGLPEVRRVAASKTRPPIFMESEKGRSMFDAGWATKIGMGVERYCAALEGAAQSDLPPLDDLRTITVPTLILAWRSDVQHPVDTAEMLRETIPNSELHIADTWDDIEQFPGHMQHFFRKHL